MATEIRVSTHGVGYGKWMIALVRGAALTSLVLSASACKDDPPPPPDACRESIEGARRVLAGPNPAAARGMADQAKKECGADRQGEVSALEREIEAAEAKQKAAQKQAEPPKPDAVSLVAPFVDVVKAYRAEKGRESCTERTCKGNRPVGELSATVATARAQANAFSVFMTFPNEFGGCGRFGANIRKQAWKSGGREKEYCVLRDGALKGMGVRIERQASPPVSDVTIFTDAWVTHDEALRKDLDEGKPPKP
jgi:hypothetical protein